MALRRLCLVNSLSRRIHAASMRSRCRWPSMAVDLLASFVACVRGLVSARLGREVAPARHRLVIASSHAFGCEQAPISCPRSRPARLLGWRMLLETRRI